MSGSVSVTHSRSDKGTTLAEVIVGLGLFSLLTLAVVGMLVQTAYLESRDTQLTETTMLADSLMERRLSAAREYQNYDALASTPANSFWLLDAGRSDGLEARYIYRVDVVEPIPAMKKLSVSVYHRNGAVPGAAADLNKGRNGHALTVGTLIAEPTR